MMDVKSAGRLTFLSPVTWKDGWPYFGLERNLGRSPRTWFKPDTGTDIAPLTTYQRDDDFSSAKLKPIWQWNHIPVDKKWSLTEKKGVLRDENDDDSVIPQITRAEFEQYVADGVIQGGMIPKLENSFEAINAGVSEVIITLASAINGNEGTRIRK